MDGFEKRWTYRSLPSTHPQSMIHVTASLAHPFHNSQFSSVLLSSYWFHYLSPQSSINLSTHPFYICVSVQLATYPTPNRFIHTPWLIAHHSFHSSLSPTFKLVHSFLWSPTAIFYLSPPPIAWRLCRTLLSIATERSDKQVMTVMDKQVTTVNT